MKIGLDFDGVIANSQQLKSAEIKKRYGVDIPPAFCKKEQAVAGGLSEDQYREIQRLVSNNRKLCLKMKPMKGARIYVSKLLAQSHQLKIISQREGAEIENAKKWLAHQGLILDFVSVGFGQSKAEAASGLDVYIDDDLDKMRSLVSIVPHLFLFSWPYNLREQENGIARRIASWQEFYQAIQAINCKH